MNKLTVDIKKKLFSAVGNQEAFTAIENLKFDVANNEFICIIGPSGCGKTTLLNTIAGLDDGFEGTISINNGQTDINTSYVFQTPRLLPWRTVLENIQLASENQSTPPANIEGLLQSLDLNNNLHSYPHHLSLGMQRRVAIARAFSVQSNILLMDEPFVSLDQPTARKARKLLLNLWQEQPRNVIFVTHDLNEAIELADRILFLSSSPSSIVANVTVDLPRKGRTITDINNVKEKLTLNHPEVKHLI